MSLPAAYLGVVFIWSTTPMAIQWSSQGPGFLFGVSSRMTIGTLICLLLILLLGQRWPWHAKARGTYLTAGLSIYLAMSAVYFSAQYIPSGWISVIFGLSPITTGVLATLLLRERALTPFKVIGMLCGVAGLAVMFSRGAADTMESAWGIGAVLFSTLVHSSSAVMIKRIDARVPALQVTAGGLVFALPLFLITWFLFDGHWPTELPSRAVTGILYLGVFGSVIGFILYYHILKHMEASRVALITLITPLTALLLGHWANGEPIDLKVIIGALLIITGLAFFELVDRIPLFNKELRV